MNTKNNDKAQLLLNEAEAAAMLTFSPRKLWSIRNAGKIPYIKSGRSIRYDPADLLAWIEQHKVLPAPSVN